MPKFNPESGLRSDGGGVPDRGNPSPKPLPDYAPDTLISHLFPFKFSLLVSLKRVRHSSFSSQTINTPPYSSHTPFSMVDVSSWKERE
ncbi:hypothetical protein Hanom_Chr01g00060361 [Helianthus anomalus]